MMRISRLDLIGEDKTFDPEENLRREVLYWKGLDQPGARVWRNDACVVLGRFLRPEEEVYLKRAKALGVPVLKRVSGGGAVYHDRGNVNYSIYLQGEIGLSNRISASLKELSFPVIELLERWNIHWEWVSPNNIYVQGKKISGSAQARWRGRILHHGTLLVNVDLERMAYLLKPGGRSRWVPVINLKEVLPQVKVEEVEEAISDLLGSHDNVSIKDWEQ
jgi:lipoate-protein ligase A